MIKKFLLLYIIVLISNISWAQADLTLTAFTTVPSSASRGDLFAANITVKNIGNRAADTSFIMLYLSKNATNLESEQITRASIKPLASGESVNIQIAYVIPTNKNYSSGIYSAVAYIDYYNEVIESDETNNFFRAGTNGTFQTFFVNNSWNNEKKIPYPILFIHGWTGYDETWNPLTNKIETDLGWTYGGVFNYCLNQDGDRTTCSGSADIKDWTNNNSINLGDYYYLNFDVSNSGKPHVGNNNIPWDDDYSNQSAIVKQGIVIGKVVKRILDLTRSEKVILVGHSMGGLASREYLHNKTLWQSDGKHHIAKILTIGTPNGGSNAVDGDIFRSFAGFDLGSEAARDFRYQEGTTPGTYLFGGLEPNGNYYRNNDVNCSNTNTRDDITGLNNRYCETDVQYSCIIGQKLYIGSLIGDGVVASERADLNNYGTTVRPPLSKPVANRFYNNASHLSVHEDVPTFLQGVDEPKTYDLAYNIELEELYFGNVTIQSTNDPFPSPYNQIDFDDYKFTIPKSGNVRILLWNLPVHDFTVYIVNQQGNAIFTIPSGGGSNIDRIVSLQAGTYFFEIGAYPTPMSYRFPYAYSLSFTPAVGPNAVFSVSQQNGCAPFSVNFGDASTGSPTSWQWVFTGGTPSTSTSRAPSVIYNNSGVYNVSLTVKNAQGVSSTINRNAYIVVGKQPTGDFQYATNGLSTNFVSQISTNNLNSYFSWSFGDGTGSNLENPEHTYLAAGNYNVNLIVSNSCGSITIPKTIRIQSTPTSEIDKKNRVLLYPNPATDKFIIETLSDTEVDYFRISDILGRQYFSNYLLDKYTEIDTRDFSNGIYILSLYSKNIKVGSMKMIIQK